ncbi:NPF8.3 [Symbiodinium pilosum]|uniref:NPF8.3 protein n=1 Tax=Symbiodinium pilosum TaxID=2952 RepID=A0A812YH38_SYMPI|nr:NPF8.3 [Symbiodinium pilosum]
MGDPVSSAALGIAINNFRCACPEPRPNCLPVLPSLVRQQRRARQMCRAIEAVTSQNVFLFLQAILVCIKALCDLLVECSTQMSQLADPDWSDEERECAQESDELQNLLLGFSSLRRLLWRLGLAAELFMSDSEQPTEGSDAKALEETFAFLANVQRRVASLLGFQPGCGQGRSAFVKRQVDAPQTATIHSGVGAMEGRPLARPVHGRTSQAFKDIGMDDPFKSFVN